MTHDMDLSGRVGDGVAVTREGGPVHVSVVLGSVIVVVPDDAQVRRGSVEVGTESEYLAERTG
jgi:hypothetical protein